MVPGDSDHEKVRSEHHTPSHLDRAAPGEDWGWRGVGGVGSVKGTAGAEGPWDIEMKSGGCQLNFGIWSNSRTCCISQSLNQNTGQTVQVNDFQSSGG